MTDCINILEIILGGLAIVFLLAYALRYKWESSIEGYAIISIMAGLALTPTQTIFAPLAFIAGMIFSFASLRKAYKRSKEKKQNDHSL